ncbi:uncharacterized protein [Ptychodera flava]|uniref:uncharacterized protein isoform X2 n=1 Tax=Ptychodera flava TaxID=63121 RepID=UPI003969E4D3
MGKSIIGQRREKKSYVFGADRLAYLMLLGLLVIFFQGVTCQVDGGWTTWTQWTACGVVCKQFRYRYCTNPTPANDGADCEGADTQEYECSIIDCPVNGGWSSWTIHTCNSECKGHKTRLCNNPHPVRGGANCVGESEQLNGDCTGIGCVTNGAWSHWTHWTDCSKTCETGSKTRYRSCTNPRPKNGGRPCPEEDHTDETTSCYLQSCPRPLEPIVYKTDDNLPPNFALILECIFGTLGFVVMVLCIGLAIRKRHLRIRRQKAMEEREKDAKYQEAIEMSMIPEGKKTGRPQSAAARQKRSELKAKLKKAQYGEKTPLMVSLEETSDTSSRPSSAASVKDPQEIMVDNLQQLDERLKEIVIFNKAKSKSKLSSDFETLKEEENVDKLTKLMKKPKHEEPSIFREIRDNFWEVPRESVVLLETLSCSASGQIWKAKAWDIFGRDGETLVAAKLLRENATAHEKAAFLRELEALKKLDTHPNIISLLGCCTTVDPIYIMMEYAKNGDLQTFLRNHRPDIPDQQASLRSRDLIVMAWQIARGMAFLANSEIVHRDLAGRNVLLDSKMVCKITNIGRVRNVVENALEGRLALRWMAPESARACSYTVKSDVWSFGILLWEIVNFACTPYPGISSRDLLIKLENGFRMERPKHCSKELYAVMKDCWHDDPARRPSFQNLMLTLQDMTNDIEQVDFINVKKFDSSECMDLDMQRPYTPAVKT